MIEEAIPGEEEVTYGWRDIYQTDEDGNEQWVRVKLTLEDFLHPREGDMYAQNISHNQIRSYIYNAMHTHLYVSQIPNYAVYWNVGIDWGVSGERHYAPDVSIFFDFYDKYRSQPIISVEQEGSAPSVLIEVTSPNSRHMELPRKYEAYERLEVPYVIFIDTGYDEAGHEIFDLMGYDWTPNGYVAITPNEQGWLWMTPVEAWIAIEDNQVRCYDADGTYIRRHEEERDARVEAERLAAEEAEARAEAERRAAEEAAARQLLEERIRALEAQLGHSTK